MRVVSSNWTSLQLIPAFQQTLFWHLMNQTQQLPGGSRRRGITTATAMASLIPSYVSITVIGGGKIAAIILLKKLAHSAGERIPCVIYWQFCAFWVKALGISLPKNNAQTMVNNAQGWNRSSNLSQELKSAILGE